ncbi:MAG: hypothetical protein ACMUHB_01715, partial [Thermoplasmatota archaeon]
MSMKKEELVLYSLNLLEGDSRQNSTYSKEQVANALDIGMGTLDLYMTNLKRDGHIDRNKKKYIDDFRQSYTITRPGKDHYEGIASRIRSETLTPERHNIPSIVPVSKILDRIDDVLERIFFVSMFTKVPRFDLPFYLETVRTAREDSNIFNLLYDAGDDSPEPVPIVESFFRSCFYGDFTESKLDELVTEGLNVNTLLLVSEASYKKARFNESMSIYDHLLSGRVKITQNQ